jgi:phospholipase C
MDRAGIGLSFCLNGFVLSYEGKTHSPSNAQRIMRCFAPEKVPVLTQLARQFAVCDRWFSSVPGPTFPNRAFALRAVPHSIWV